MKWKQHVGGGRRNWGKLGMPTVFILCSLFFVIGLFGSTFRTHDMPSIQSPPQLLDTIHDLAKDKIIDDVDDDNLELDTSVKKKAQNDDDNRDLDYSIMDHGLSGEPTLHSIPFQILSWKPRALYFPNFATAHQCQTIIDLAKTRLKPSKLALRTGETAASTKGIRTSSGTFLSASEDSSGVLEAVEHKIARATLTPRSHGEAFNILRYKIGQRYVSHYDAFNPAEYGPQKSQRMASFLLYLSDVEEGGETMFPFENGSNMDIGYDYEKCIGLKVKPRRGDGLLFYSLTPNGTIDPASLHGSCPVIKGEKWVATKWIRDQHQNYS